ncbi:hypothetical protein N0V91_000030 [Didymella pomorum]|uniref:Uncharacterized protein n=1 Tax=Didymella pomorum TaxID=749634 RepID=A0A9W8ZPN4_9PLEO|nr:hypothetical protein N0V91_000030 [Didymella pomorum]
MSESSQNPNPPQSDPPQEFDPTKPVHENKVEARTAGGPNTNEDVFKIEDFPGATPGAAHTPPGEEEKIGITEALRMKSKDWAKDEDKNDGSKDGGSNTNTT